MRYENDFVDEKPIELDVGGRKFKYKPTTGGDENEWLKEVMQLDPIEKVPIVNWSLYNRKKLENITEVPYEAELIKKVIGKEAEWSALNSDDRYKFLSKLKPKLFDDLINAMKVTDEPDTKSLKN